MATVKKTAAAAGAGLGILAAAAGAAAAGYYFYGSEEGKKHRKIAAKWAGKLMLSSRPRKFKMSTERPSKVSL
jgi:predicted RNA methylase